MSGPLLLDANALISLFDGDDAELEKALSKADELVVPVVAYAEVYAGTESAHQRAIATQQALQGLIQMPNTRMHAIGQQTAILYSKLFNFLKKNGRMIPTNDIWIAASALELGGTLFSRDKHFKELPMLQTIGLR